MQTTSISMSVFLVLATSASAADAAQVSKECYSKAESAVYEYAEPTDYDEGGIQAFECSVAPNNKAIICGIGASKADGAAMDTYQVVLNTSCNKVFRVELTGEE